MPKMSSPYRGLPSVASLLDHPLVREVIPVAGQETVTTACRDAVEELRRCIRCDGMTTADVAEARAALPGKVRATLDRALRPAYRQVINATGVLLHTNLGRAPLTTPLPTTLASYLALEYDIEHGRRGQRLAPLRERLTAVCGGEWAVMVNNNAAAVLLTLAGLARDREVVVSRGQLVEIGGSFRLPEVMALSGARLVEVGCTNRTHLEDYRRALGDATGAILVAHPSNFRVVGFTAMPSLEALSALAHEHGLPLIVDQGTGHLHRHASPGLADEPTVSETLAAGADVVCFSGDKLLGGPQAGLIVGGRRWVEPLGRHPLYRALRPDKTALVVMDRTLAAHRSGRLDDLPLYALLRTPPARLQRRARAAARRLRAVGVPTTECSTRSTLGGGTTPAKTVPSFGIAVAAGQELADQLRLGEPPVVVLLEEDRVVMDLRSVFAAQDRVLVAAVQAAWQRLSASGRR